MLFVCLTYFTEYDDLYIHPSYCKDVISLFFLMAVSNYFLVHAYVAPFLENTFSNLLDFK